MIIQNQMIQHFNIDNIFLFQVDLGHLTVFSTHSAAYQTVLKPIHSVIFPWSLRLGHLLSVAATGRKDMIVGAKEDVNEKCQSWSYLFEARKENNVKMGLRYVNNTHQVPLRCIRGGATTHSLIQVVPVFFICIFFGWTIDEANTAKATGLFSLQADSKIWMRFRIHNNDLQYIWVPVVMYDRQVPDTVPVWQEGHLQTVRYRTKFFFTNHPNFIKVGKKPIFEGKM